MILSRLLPVLVCCGASPLSAQTPERPPWNEIPAPFDQYLAHRVTEISSDDWISELTPENWPEKRAEMRGQLQRMLGLDPWPERTPLNPVTTGRVEGDGYTVEKLYFEPLPGLYIAANLYLPAEVSEPLPTILYMSGHAKMSDGDVRLGNKTGYQHHGSWFARHGYVCLIPDTLDNGEIPGAHHGTHRLDRWWWPSRGYTPAGVETWIGIRALDYLETRPEVDRSRIGMTGRSGGGVYTWWVGAMDERIKVAVPVAGITNLHDHVVGGAIEGHCDCMFMVNTERWDFDRVAALMAPRPLLISNTDSDTIFPLAGVMEIFNRTRTIYRLLGEEEKVGIHIAEGPHKDTQPLNFGAFNWMNRFLKGGDREDLIDEPASKRHEPRELKVFTTIPADETVTTVDEFFVPPFSPPAVPSSAEDWAALRDGWMRALDEEVFGAWPEEPEALASQIQETVKNGLRLSRLQFVSQEHLPLSLWTLHAEDLKPEEVGGIDLRVLDDSGWEKFRSWEDAGMAGDVGFGEDALRDPSRVIAIFCPRGVGPTSLADLPETKRTHLLRRLLLLGESLETGQIWDIRRAAAALRALPDFSDIPLTLQGEGVMATNLLYASLYLDGLAGLELRDLPATHATGPSYPNVLKHLDLPQTLAMAAERTPVTLHAGDAAPWRFAREVADSLGWKDRLRTHTGGGSGE